MVAMSSSALRCETPSSRDSIAGLQCRSSRDVRLGLQAPPQRGEAVMRQVFVQVQRIEFAEMFGGDMHLAFQKGADGGIAFAHGKARHLLLRRGLIQQQAVQQRRSRAGRRGAAIRADENAVARGRRPGRASGSA